MTFPCTCPACEHVNHVEWSRIGREMYCGGCGKPFVVPAPMETITRAKPPADTVRFRCPACGKKYSANGRLAGQKIRCKGCGGGVRVPSDKAHSAPHSSNFKRRFSGAEDGPPPSGRQPHDSSEGPSVHPSLPDLDRLSKSEPEIPARSGEDHEDEDEESVDDLSPILDDPSVLKGRKKPIREARLGSRTEAMARVSQEAAEEAARQDRKKWEQARKRAKLKKKAHSGYFDPKETLAFVAWVSAFVGILAFLAWGYPDFRFPLGGLLCVTGFIVYLLGWASLKQLVAEEGDFKAIVFRFFPPYQWWFVWTRWSEAKDYAVFFAAGFLIMSIGGAVIKTSPIGKKAEKSEQALQKMRKENTEKSATPPGMSRSLGIDVE